MKSHVELHIEQGRILGSNGEDIGVVTGIVGLRWFSPTFRGEQAHAGATPMNIRCDPMVPPAKTSIKIR
ncbi:MAG: hypothetical protein QW688_09550 [Thermoprotei archaeon]